MIEKVIEFSIRNRFLVLVTAGALTVFAIRATLRTPIDAIPDLSENQVIVFTDWTGRSPREIEDQITYPLSRKLQGLAGVKAVRSSSEFNFSMITIIFDDSIDFYFARQRVSERLDQASTFLPPGVAPYLAPDATALGQVFWYTVETSADNPVEPGRLWAMNKFYITQQLNSAAGVADVAVVGGMPLEYQIDVKPETLRAYGITLGELYGAVSRSNMPAGGGVIQKNNAEYLVRGVGWVRGVADIENSVVKEVEGTPIYVKNIARVQLGTQFRRSVYEKDGNEAVGGVVLMRHGENPLAVTERVKAKIRDLQPGLPSGVHIVPAYDRTRLIRGAIDTLSQVMWHEMVIASAAILLVLMHVRSVFVICVTLPLSVLFSFLLMSVLRSLGVVDIQANIMSLAGITISIGVLVDQAIVMTENATHHLKAHFGDRKVSGDIREFVIPACRTVGRPIFFSVLIMLVSFLPVFLLTGREGKLFHPLAFTKSFALVGVALLSITVVPALIPTFLKGRLRGENESWLVRSLIQVYKPLLSWALDRRNLVMWMFAALLILAAGLFPLQAVFGIPWKTAYLINLALVVAVTVYFTHGWHWQLVSLATLVLLGLWAHGFPKIGVSFMPPLDEGTTLDMPITVPRASVTQVADDLKARDALLRGFPEVESVIGKAGRAETPTDPAPLDMVETFVNYRPHEYWPKRVLRYRDAAAQVDAVVRELAAKDFIRSPSEEDERQNLINESTQRVLERFDESMREAALAKYVSFEKGLEQNLAEYAMDRTIAQVQASRQWINGPGWTDDRRMRLLVDLRAKYGRWLALHPSMEDAGKLSLEVVDSLAAAGLVNDPVAALKVRGSQGSPMEFLMRGVLGEGPPPFARVLAGEIEARRTELWREEVGRVNWELFDFGVETFTLYAVEETVKTAKGAGLLVGAANRTASERFADDVVQIQLDRRPESTTRAPFLAIGDGLVQPFANRVFFWPRQPGPKGDLVDDELGRVLQVPGWSNIFTQPIINRIEMLSTGVRTDIGVKVFGPDLDVIDRVGKEVEAALKPVPGARDVVAAPIMGKGYVEIEIDRERAARYGITVEDVQDQIEVALAGRAITLTVEKRERFPIRVRYARSDRRDEESIRRLLVGGSRMAGQSSGTKISASGPTDGRRSPTASEQTGDRLFAGGHLVGPPHASTEAMIPLNAVADVRVVEGPAAIKSENGRLLNYVTLNIRGRDVMGFVDEAQRVVARKVALPEGVHIEWSGEFEHQVRAARTLLFVALAVVVLMFVILYWTYHDFVDALLMMLAVPEALAGGAFFLSLFPKFTDGWDAPPVDFTVAVWVGFIACAGMATETGIIMLVYLREAIEKRGGLEKIRSLEELREAVIEGAVHRLRPKLLTEGVAILAIFPMVFAKGAGAEILAPMALPVLGGLLISDEVVDLFLPVRFYWVRRARWLKLHANGDPKAGPQPMLTV